MPLHTSLVSQDSLYKPRRQTLLPHNKQELQLLPLVPHLPTGNPRVLVGDKAMAKPMQLLARLNQAMDNNQAKDFPRFLCMSQMWHNPHSCLHLLLPPILIQFIYQDIKIPR